MLRSLKDWRGGVIITEEKEFERGVREEPVSTLS